ncbi:MAG: NifU family protein [Flavobacteriaceae bacterium]|nr:NifU family protein [Flavobacteriaceae bacterium]
MSSKTSGKTHEQVLQALESIRPFLKRDGGDIELIEVKDNIVYVKLLGNCSGCHISDSTMKLGVENVVKQFAPEIKSVINLDK